MSTVATSTTVARATRLVLDELDRARIVPTSLSAATAPSGAVVVSVDLASRADAEVAACLLNLRPLRVTNYNGVTTQGRPFAGIDLIASIDCPLPVEMPADCYSAELT